MRCAGPAAPLLMLAAPLLLRSVYAGAVLQMYGVAGSDKRVRDKRWWVFHPAARRSRDSDPASHCSGAASVTRTARPTHLR